jgi:hypothetical protein
MSNRKVTFIDVEALRDEKLHEAYLAIDRNAADKTDCNGHVRHRIACKRVIAAAAFDLEVLSGGAIAIGGLRAWDEYGYGDEQEVVARLFEHLRERPDTHVVTWGGLAAELPLLNLAAIEHRLTLPPQLQTNASFIARRKDWRPHIDLALQMKAQGREWSHMTEIGLRLGLPGELFAGKAEIAEPCSSEEWEAMRHRVSTDCILTAMIALAYWRANGLIKLKQPAALLMIADWCLRTRCVADAHVKPLTRVRAAMLARMGAEWEAA